MVSGFTKPAMDLRQPRDSSFELRILVGNTNFRGGDQNAETASRSWWRGIKIEGQSHLSRVNLSPLSMKIGEEYDHHFRREGVLKKGTKSPFPL